VAAFALGAGQGVFLVRLRMQKDGKVPPHRGKALGHHGFGGAAHHQPITVMHRQAEQGIAHCATNLVNLHGRED
jgi:hypothetical protein